MTLRSGRLDDFCPACNRACADLDTHECSKWKRNKLAPARADNAEGPAALPAAINPRDGRDSDTPPPRGAQEGGNHSEAPGQEGHTKERDGARQHAEGEGVALAKAAPSPGEGMLPIERLAEALAGCVEFDELQDIHDQATAAEGYYRQRKASLEMQNAAAAVRLRAERKLGEILRALKIRPGRKNPDAPVNINPALADLTITYRQSSMWQRIAAIAEDDFEQRVADATINGLELTTARALGTAKPPAPAKPPQKPASPVSAVEQRQQESADAGGTNADRLDTLRRAGETAYVEWDEAGSYAPLVSWARDFLKHVEQLERARSKRS